MTMKTKLPGLLLCALAGSGLLQAANPYLPLWEHIPDGEPYVFDDPDVKGRKRVYIYGSHDIERSAYCGRNQVVWSADIDSLDRWRYDGVIFESVSDGAGNFLRGDGRGDILYAPDVTEVTAPDGSKLYYLYPNTQNDGRTGQIAVSSRPDGPFKVCNWSDSDPRRCYGILGFDPGVLTDDDGRVYGYWGFGRSHAAELDPATMCTPLEGTEVIEDMIGGFETDSLFRFFEASSIRKIKDKYVLVYSRMSAPDEWGLPAVNYTLAYAYSDAPLGPWTYGGTIIDARGRDTDAEGKTIPTTTPYGNTHGSILQIGPQWYVFYHRQTGLDEYARQAMVSPIEVTVEEGPGGKVTISEAELTSEGFELNGLDPRRRHAAGIASVTMGPEPVKHEYPLNVYSGPWFEPFYLYGKSIADPYAEDINVGRVVNCTDGSTVGWKYFNFDLLPDARNPKLLLGLIPQGIDGTIEIYTDAPWKGKANPVGSIALRADMAADPVVLTAPLKFKKPLSGRVPLYLVFSSPEKGKSMATLETIAFE